MLVTGWAFVAVAAAMFSGAIVQRAVGFGMILAAFPVLALVEPALLPRTTLMAGASITIYNAWLNRGDVPWREVAWLLVGRAPGMALGFWALTRLEPSAIAITGGVVIIVSMLVSLASPAVTRTPLTLVVVGTVSSVFGVTLSIGGPYLSLLYQREDGERVRSVLSFMMMTAAPANLLLLFATGQMRAADVRTGLALIPVCFAGLWAGHFVIRWVDERMRPAILWICVFATAMALARVVLL